MRRTLAAAVLLACLLSLTACASILDGQRTVVEPHVPQSTPTPALDAVPAASYDELYAVVYGMVAERQSRGEVHVFEYEGTELDLADTLHREIDRVRDAITRTDALGAYSVADITASVTQIVTYCKLDVEITYRRAPSQVDAIVSASTTRYLRSQLTEMLSDRRGEAAILTSLPSVTADSILAEIESIYYANPLRVVMLPITAVTVYPESGSDAGTRIFELNFSYDHTEAVLSANLDLMLSAARELARQASGANDLAIHRSLTQKLGEIATYNDAHGALPDYSRQNFEATAYGALQGGSANAEGYAMAYKALCDELQLACVVVRGERDGRRYAWNIVTVAGASYHIDAAMCDEDDENAWFLRADTAMADAGYTWDRAAYPTCAGDGTAAIDN
ncbi:MAG: hypothetical protein LBN02_01905 [Oscillospiraceae bacterium]|nr:hypothetical protein [Oscillospiraceae bacterium]